MKSIVDKMPPSALIAFPTLPSNTETLRTATQCQFCGTTLAKGRKARVVKSDNSETSPNYNRFHYYIFCDEQCHKMFGDKVETALY